MAKVIIEREELWNAIWKGVEDIFPYKEGFSRSGSINSAKFELTLEYVKNKEPEKPKEVAKEKQPYEQGSWMNEDE